MVTWKRRQTQEEASEEPGLDPQIAARLERLARESAVPIGASWQELATEAPAEAEEPVMALAATAAESANAVETPVAASAEAPATEALVEVEKRTDSPPLTVPKGGLIALQVPREGSEGGHPARPSRAVSQGRKATSPMTARPVSAKPLEGPRRTTIPVKGTVPRPTRRSE